MKHKIIVCLSLLLLALNLASCDWLASISQSQRSETQENAATLDSSAQKTSDRDSAVPASADQSGKPTGKPDSTKVENINLKSQDGKSATPGKWWHMATVVAIVLAVACLLFTLLVSSQSVDKDEFSEKLKGIKERLDGHQKKLDELKGKTGAQVGSSRLSVELENLNRRIRDLEKRIESTEAPVSGDRPVSPMCHLREGYAKSNSSKYFTEILTSEQEVCVYKITFKSDTQGEFTILSLPKMRQTSGWRDIVDITQGSCAVEDAKNFNVKEMGMCEKRDECWKIKKNLTIELI